MSFNSPFVHPSVGLIFTVFSYLIIHIFFFFISFTPNADEVVLIEMVIKTSISWYEKRYQFPADLNPEFHLRDFRIQLRQRRRTESKGADRGVDGGNPPPPMKLRYKFRKMPFWIFREGSTRGTHPPWNLPKIN